MSIATRFDPPAPSDNPTTFNAKAFATLGALNTWSDEANATAAAVSADKAAAANSATSAAGSASTATTKAGEANASALIAAAAAQTLMQKNRIDNDWSIPDGYNAITIGPFEVSPDVTVTGLGNSNWIGV